MSQSLLSQACVHSTQSTPSIQYSHVGSGKRVLLVIGFSMRADIWRPQIEGLGLNHHVAWYDNRGIGGSERGGEALPSIKDFAGDGLRVLDALEWDDDVHLVGVSMGGMIAQEMALMAPSRFRSLTLIATHPGGGLLGKLPPLPGIARFLGSFWLPKVFRIRSITGLLYPPHFVKTMDQGALKKRIKAQLGRPAPKPVILKQMLAVLRFDTTKRLASLGLPTLILRPGEDILVSPRHSDHLDELLPDTTLVEFPDAGHGLIFQCADGVNQAIVRHIERHDSKG